MRFTGFASILVAGLTAGGAFAAEPVPFGVCEHLHGKSDYAAQIDEMAAAGIKWVRISPEWGAIQPTSATYNQAFLTKLDDIVDRLTSRGINVLWILCYTAPWASSQSTQPWSIASRVRPADWSTWETYVRFITTRYNGKISHWEVWNEPDLFNFWRGTVAEYGTLLEKAAAQIRGVNPNNKVLLGGLATFNGTVDHYGPGTFFDTLLAGGAAPHFDVVNYHAYGSLTRMRAIHDAMRRVMDQHGIGGRPIWITEAGYSSFGDPNRENDKAALIDQIYDFHARQRGVEKIFLYLYRNPVVVNADGSHNLEQENFGVVRESGRTPLKGFYSLQAAGGARTDFRLQAAYPAQAPVFRALYWVPGGGVSDAAADGSVKRVPASGRMSFRVHDEWIFEGNGGLDDRIQVDVTYWDAGGAPWALEYDAETGARRRVLSPRTGAATWVTKTFVLDDAFFANRQEEQADFRIDPGSAELLVREVAVRRAFNPARSAIGAADASEKMLRWVLDPNPANEGHAPLASAGGRDCRRIADNSKLLYFQVSDALATGPNAVTVRFRYWDEGTDGILVQYLDAGGALRSARVAKGGTSSWRTASLSLPDAALSNGLSYAADFRITNAADGSAECVDLVEVEAAGRPDLALETSSTVHPGASPDARAYVYPNPAVGRNPVFRAQMGGVESVEITVFDAAGRAVHAARVDRVSFLSGDEPVFEYEWAGRKSAGVYHAVVQGRRDGDVVRARARFVVLR